MFTTLVASLCVSSFSLEANHVTAQEISCVVEKQQVASGKEVANSLNFFRTAEERKMEEEADNAH